MKIDFEPIRNWFGFTRRERRSAFLLLLIIIVIIALRYTVPEQNMEVEDLTDQYIASAIEHSFENSKTTYSAQLFSFDPNKSSYDTLILLGLTEKEAGTLINYRNKGGKFRYPEDINKVYGIDDSKAARLVPYVVVTPDKLVVTSKNRPVQDYPPIELNSCDSSSLVRLPGIGPVLAARIIRYRRLLGSYASVEQLREVYGLPQETYDMIKDRLRIDKLNVKRININTADYKQLDSIPYLEKYEIISILKYRELQGKIHSADDLVSNKILSYEKAEKVEPYLIIE